MLSRTNPSRIFYIKFTVALLCVIMCITCTASDNSSIAANVLTDSSTEERKHRIKRRVVFSKNSKIFFRVNGKDNVIPWVTVFAHGWGFRANYDLPDTIAKRFHFFKRDIHEEIEDLTNVPSAYHGYACIFKHLCEVVRNINFSEFCGMFCEIGNIITNSEGLDSTFFKSFVSKCDLYDNLCPYSIDLYNSHIYKNDLHNYME